MEFGQVVSFNYGSDRTTLPSIRDEMIFSVDDPAVLVTEGTATGNSHWDGLRLQR